MTNTSIAVTPAISTPESFIDFNVEKTLCVNKGKAENSESDKAKSKQKKLLFYLLRRESYFSLFPYLIFPQQGF